MNRFADSFDHAQIAVTNRLTELCAQHGYTYRLIFDCQGYIINLYRDGQLVMATSGVTPDELFSVL